MSTVVSGGGGVSLHGWPPVWLVSIWPNASKLLLNQRKQSKPSKINRRAAVILPLWWVFSAQGDVVCCRAVVIAATRRSDQICFALLSRRTFLVIFSVPPSFEMSPSLVVLIMSHPLFVSSFAFFECQSDDVSIEGSDVSINQSIHPSIERGWHFKDKNLDTVGGGLTSRHCICHVNRTKNNKKSPGLDQFLKNN